MVISTLFIESGRTEQLSLLYNIKIKSRKYSVPPLNALGMVEELNSFTMVREGQKDNGRNSNYP